MNSIHLYAEVLLNIKSVSLSANVISDEGRPSQALLFVDAGTLRLKHGDDEVKINLPCKTPAQNPTSFQLSASRDKTLSLRLTPERESYSLVEAEDDQINRSPWDASIFSADVTLRCSECDTSIIPSQTMKEWKDLPSENWAEMMDFWHCHKPDVPGTNGSPHDAPAKKGYAASNTFLASRGVGLVSISSFLFAREDVDHMVEQNMPIGINVAECNIRCAHCSAPLGSTDENACGVRLLKSSLQLSHVDDSRITRVPVQKWISEHLLNLVETQAVRKFLVRPKKSQAHVIWVFTPDYLFCSVQTTNSTQYTQPTRAMKILSKQISAKEVDILESDKSPTAAVEDLNLPVHLHDTLVETLQENALVVPTSARSWGEWKVSFLRRFNAKDLTAISYSEA